ncbi:hypothetical protein EZS27_025004 [termite gut metagenome]|uniref:Uncharacterized protein n=1 Tax=termite gut metagenome TaxID=433724 RepID=A0A5J4QWD9_9ZZZZ
MDYLIILYKTLEDYQYSNKKVSIFALYNKQIIRMRIRSLLVIVSVFFASFVVVSCLGSDTVIEYSSDDTIYAFELDTVYRVNYAFTIDQIKGKIFNKDSMPVGADTIINRILITNLEVMGYVLTGDSLLNMSDSLDLSKTMEKPLQLTVLAPDGVSKKDYEVEVRVHRQEPDSLIWTQRTSYLLEGGSITGRPKAVLLGDTILVYTPDREVYRALLNNGNEGVWKEDATDLPVTADLSSMLAFNDTLYVVTTDDKVLVSADGLSWSEDTRLSGQGIEALIGSFPDMIAGIKHDTEEKKFFCTTTSDLSGLSGWEKGDELPETSPLFPLKSISSMVYKTKTGLWKTFMMGNVDDETNPVSLIPWFSLDGLRWTAVEAPLSSDDAVSYSCPYMLQPSIIRYDDKFYAFGSNFEAFYVSTEGITWSKVKKLILFPVTHRLSPIRINRINRKWLTKTAIYGLYGVDRVKYGGDA